MAAWYHACIRGSLQSAPRVPHLESLLTRSGILVYSTYKSLTASRCTYFAGGIALEQKCDSLACIRLANFRETPYAQ